MLRTIYLYELKKLFRARVNLIALAGAVLMLLFLVIFSISEVQPVSREAAKELDGRTIDEELIEEMKPAMRFENGSTLMEITTESEKYVPVMEVITSVTGYYRDLTRFDGSEFYALREQELKQRIEKQGLSETDKEFSGGAGFQTFCVSFSQRACKPAQSLSGTWILYLSPVYCRPVGRLCKRNGR